MLSESFLFLILFALITNNNKDKMVRSKKFKKSKEVAKKGKTSKEEKKETKKEIRKGVFRKIWHFLWESNSIISWFICLMICFLLVVFVFFPLASFIFATPLPFVVVESSSMEHYGNFNEWWSSFGEWYVRHNITKNDTLSWPFCNGIDKGDIVIVKKAGEYRKGDVIVFAVTGELPIIHRVIAINGNVSTKGDNNRGQLPRGKENNIAKERIFGKAIAKIPKLGWVKLFFCSHCPRCCNLMDKIRS